MADFSGKVVIVTGAGTGIGAATAQRFARDGASVVLAGRRIEKLQQLASGLEPERVLVRPADVSKEADAAHLVEAAMQKFGRLDVLVNNAGVAVFGGFLELSLDDYRRTMATNVDGVIYCTRAAMPHLLESRGSVVNVSSVSGTGGDWGLAYYNASKGALGNLTRSLALEFGGRGVRVNAVNPSLTITDMSQGLVDNPDMLGKFMDRSPLGRAAMPADVADVIVFLASEDARFVTGVNLPVDGGISASNGQPRML